MPTEFDTGANESHHKESKHAARLTQRKEATFNFQTAKRLTEFLCIDLGMEEIENDGRPWEYFKDAVEERWDADHDGNDEELVPEDAEMDGPESDQEEEELKIVTGGTRIKIFEDEEMMGNLLFSSSHVPNHNGRLCGWTRLLCF